LNETKKAAKAGTPTTAHHTNFEKPETNYENKPMKHITLIIATLIATSVFADPCGMVPPIYTGPGVPITRIKTASSRL